MNKIAWVIGITLLAGALYFLTKPRDRAAMTTTPNIPTATAIGYHGASQISKNMTQTQRTRLEKNFLQTPALPVTNQSHPQPGIPPILNQVQSVNQFNAQQQEVKSR